ncbi:hypothetical protein [Ramlibacter sp.]|uniref:hypothetical protein n=1 Tax=Ramlibacter sp. TaxID=1917967 RepID=UPI002D2E160B|nr:hypothetical protein [Ramlibacter sp.]HYD76646.1 hypothetical protein [Ramlibacter sp.]
MSRPPRRPPRTPALEAPFLYGDRIPQAEAQERDTETSWALFQELHERHEARFADTVPATAPLPLGTERAFAPTRPNPLPAAAPATARVTLEQLLAESRRNDRVCPLPGAWQALYQLLPDKRQEGAFWQPPPPISGAAWKATSALPKRLCLRDHLEWAVARGAGAAVLDFLRGLPEEEWLHL